MRQPRAPKRALSSNGSDFRLLRADPLTPGHPISSSGSSTRSSGPPSWTSTSDCNLLRDCRSRSRSRARDQNQAVITACASAMSGFGSDLRGVPGPRPRQCGPGPVWVNLALRSEKSPGSLTRDASLCEDLYVIITLCRVSATCQARPGARCGPAPAHGRQPVRLVLDHGAPAPALSGGKAS